MSYFLPQDSDSNRRLSERESSHALQSAADVGMSDPESRASKISRGSRIPLNPTPPEEVKDYPSQQRHSSSHEDRLRPAPAGISSQYTDSFDTIKESIQIEEASGQEAFPASIQIASARELPLKKDLAPTPGQGGPGNHGGSASQASVSMKNSTDLHLSSSIKNQKEQSSILHQAAAAEPQGDSPKPYSQLPMSFELSQQASATTSILQKDAQATPTLSYVPISAIQQASAINGTPTQTPGKPSARKAGPEASASLAQRPTTAGVSRGDRRAAGKMSPQAQRSHAMPLQYNNPEFQATMTTEKGSLLKSLNFYGQYTPVSQSANFGIGGMQHEGAFSQRETAEQLIGRDPPLTREELEFQEWRRRRSGSAQNRGQANEPRANQRSRSYGAEERSVSDQFRVYNPFGTGPSMNNYMGRGTTGAYKSPSKFQVPTAENLLSDARAMIEMEARVIADSVKSQIQTFYEMYDRKVKENLTHPYFKGLDASGENYSKVQLLTEQVEMLEKEVAKRIKDLVWAQSLLKKDQIVTKKRLGEAVTDKQLELALDSFRAHVQDQLAATARSLSELRGTLANQRFEISTHVLNQVKGMLPSLLQTQDVPDSVPVQDKPRRQSDQASPLPGRHPSPQMMRQMSPQQQQLQTPLQAVTVGAFTAAKSEIYDYINLKVGELTSTFGNRFEMLSAFVTQDQEDIQNLKAVKNDQTLRIEDIRTMVDARDKILRDSIQENAQQIVHASSTLKDLSSHVLRLKNQFNDFAAHAPKASDPGIGEEKFTQLKEHLVAKVDLFLKNKEELQRQKEEQVEQPLQITEVAKQIQMLTGTLSNFEKDNLAKIEKNERAVAEMNTLSQALAARVETLKQDLDKGKQRQQEVEQDFIQSFQQIKQIVIDKFSLFDRQIESREEAQRVSASIQKLEATQKRIEEETLLVKKKVALLEPLEGAFDQKLISINDTISIRLTELETVLTVDFEKMKEDLENRIEGLEGRMLAAPITGSVLAKAGSREQTPSRNPQFSRTQQLTDQAHLPRFLQSHLLQTNSVEDPVDVAGDLETKPNPESKKERALRETLSLSQGGLGSKSRNSFLSSSSPGQAKSSAENKGISIRNFTADDNSGGGPPTVDQKPLSEIDEEGKEHHKEQRPSQANSHARKESNQDEVDIKKFGLDGDIQFSLKNSNKKRRPTLDDVTSGRPTTAGKGLVDPDSVGMAKQKSGGDAVPFAQFYHKQEGEAPSEAILLKSGFNISEQESKQDGESALALEKEASKPRVSNLNDAEEPSYNLSEEKSATMGSVSRKAVLQPPKSEGGRKVPSPTPESDDEDAVTNPFVTEKQDQLGEVHSINPLSQPSSDSFHAQKRVDATSDKIYLKNTGREGSSAPEQPDFQKKQQVPPLPLDNLNYEVVGQTQNILVIGDKRDESKPSSQPSSITQSQPSSNQKFIQQPESSRSGALICPQFPPGTDRSQPHLIISEISQPSPPNATPPQGTPLQRTPQQSTPPDVTPPQVSPSPMGQEPILDQQAFLSQNFPGFSGRPSRRQQEVQRPSSRKQMPPSEKIRLRNYDKPELVHLNSSGETIQPMPSNESTDQLSQEQIVVDVAQTQEAQKKAAAEEHHRRQLEMAAKAAAEDLQRKQEAELAKQRAAEQTKLKEQEEAAKRKAATDEARRQAAAKEEADRIAAVKKQEAQRLAEAERAEKARAEEERKEQEKIMNKQADTITFEILSDMVALEVAKIFKTTIRRPAGDGAGGVRNSRSPANSKGGQPRAAGKRP